MPWRPACPHAAQGPRRGVSRPPLGPFQPWRGRSPLLQPPCCSGPGDQGVPRVPVVARPPRRPIQGAELACAREW